MDKATTTTQWKSEHSKPHRIGKGEKMYYVTYCKKPKEKQITVWDVLNGVSESFLKPDRNTYDTVTFKTEEIPFKMLATLRLNDMVMALRRFVNEHEALINGDIDSHYHPFKIPKKTGGFRQIDQPDEELKQAQRQLKRIFETTIGTPYHTCAFAYIPHRSCLMSVQRHQSNHSRWFAKFDFSKFFPNTTLEFVLKMLSKIYPYNEIMTHALGKEYFEKALKVAMYGGRLPQGSPLSPMLTNIMMIPIDLEIAKWCREHTPHLVYTRYADDILISSEYDFKWHEVQLKLVSILQQFETPFSLNAEKTRYGSSAGRNWNLGLMLNKDGDITVGYKRKKILKATLFSFMMSDAKGEKWDLPDCQELLGNLNYCRNIEKETTEKILDNLSIKFNKNVYETLISALKAR